MDPFTALAMLKAAYSGIQYCCEALGEGKVEIQRIKKTVEQGVGDAKAIYKEVSGLWAWFQKLLGLSAGPQPVGPASAAPKAAEPAAKPAGKKSKQREQYIEHIPTEDEVVQQFIGHLGDFFDSYATLSHYITKRYDEVFGKDVIDPKEVLELTTLQAEKDSAYMKLSEMMRVRAPKQLGPLWSQFNEMNDKVKAGQEARALKQKREKAKRDAQAAQARSDQIDRNMTWFWALITVAYFWALMGAVWLNTSTMQ